MKRIETILIEEKKQLEKVVKEAKKRLCSAPKGRLRIDGKANTVEYYYKSEAEAINLHRKTDKGNRKISKYISSNMFKKFIWKGKPISQGINLCRYNF